jgi:hypothetical protein
LIERSAGALLDQPAEALISALRTKFLHWKMAGFGQNIREY